MREALSFGREAAGEIKRLWGQWKREAAERRALQEIVSKPHDHWLKDAGLTHETARRLLNRQSLSCTLFHGMRSWMRLRNAR